MKNGLKEEEGEQEKQEEGSRDACPTKEPERPTMPKSKAPLSQATNACMQHACILAPGPHRKIDSPILVVAQLPLELLRLGEQLQYTV